MGEIKLNGYVVNELDLTNDLKAPGQLDIESRTTFNVQYVKDSNKCVATCVVDMMLKSNPNDFNYKISVRGMFEYDEDMDKKEIHTATYDELFPFVRAITVNTFVNAGLPPIMLQKVKMNAENINVSGNGGEPKVVLGKDGDVKFTS